VTGYRIARDQLVYFELKDEGARCLCFALIHEMGQLLEDGMEVKVTGTPKLFQKTGGFHLRVIGVELVGIGALQRSFELLKRKLEHEGLFDARWKKSIPRFPESIGIITSPSAAAYTDILKRLDERWGGLAIVLAPVAVQGATAPRAIVGAIQYFNESHPVDTIILTRGGGSLEDLQAFNHESVARAVFASNIPIICGVGHERDVTLADLAADVRASTPTNAAELVIPHRREILQQLAHQRASLSHGIDRLLQSYTHRAAHAMIRAWHRIEYLLQTVSHLISRFSLSIDRYHGTLARAQERMVQLAHRLHALSPRATLARGYSITRRRGRIVRQATLLSDNDILETELAHGAVTSKVVPSRPSLFD